SPCDRCGGRWRRRGRVMAAVHEVIARDGTCLYRGADVELACEVYTAAPDGARLRCRADRAAAVTCLGQASAADSPVPYALTAAGYAVTSSVRPRRRANQREAPVPYLLTERAADLFVVDTANVPELRRRCPELFAPRPDGAA